MNRPVRRFIRWLLYAGFLMPNAASAENTPDVAAARLLTNWEPVMLNKALYRLQALGFSLSSNALPDKTGWTEVLKHTSLRCLQDYQGQYHNGASSGFSIADLPAQHVDVYVRCNGNSVDRKNTLLHELVHAWQYWQWAMSLANSDENAAAHQLNHISQHVHVEGVTTHYRSLAALKRTSVFGQHASQHLSDFAHVIACMEFQAYAIQTALEEPDLSPVQQVHQFAEVVNTHVIRRYLGRIYPEARITGILLRCQNVHSLNPADMYQEFAQR